MSELLSGLLAVAVVLFVIIRRFGTRRIDERRLLILPAVLAFVGLSQGGAIDTSHTALSAGLLAAEVAVALACGRLLGTTTRVWQTSEGPRSRGTKATFGVFLLSVAARGGLLAVGYAEGVHAGNGAIMLPLAAWLLAQNVVIVRRSRALPARVSVYP